MKILKMASIGIRHPLRVVPIFCLLLITHCSLLIAAAQSVSFIAIGDWGREGKYLQQETADQMGKYAHEHKTDFIISTGDNIYPSGVTDTDDSKWQTCFEQVYNATSLQIPWYISLGNHDYYGNVQAQIDYSTLSSRWKMPARYYSFEKAIDDYTSALFIIIDTNPFEIKRLKSYKEYKGLDDSTITARSKEYVKNQLYWIDSVLSHSNAKWKIAAGHHPVYSGGEHGNTDELIELLKPMLEKYNVNMYICGHDHDIQYLKPPASNVHYFVSGAGSQLRKTGSMEYTVYSNSINGFLAVTISNQNISASFIDVNGNNLYTVEIK
jgi:predicted MPP superfamily phosphohydrolase